MEKSTRKLLALAYEDPFIRDYAEHMTESQRVALVKIHREARRSADEYVRKAMSMLEASRRVYS